MDRTDRTTDRTTDRDTRDARLNLHTQTPFSTHGSYRTSNGPTATQLIALVTLVPLSGILFVLAGLCLTGSLIGLAIATPVFLLFSPVIVPAVLVLGLAVTGFLSSGAFGLTGLSALSRVVGYIQIVGQRMPEELDYAKRRMADVVAFTGQKTKDVGQTLESKARESGTTGATTTTTGHARA